MRKLRLALALLLVLLSLVVLAWGMWPVIREQRILRLSPSEMTLPTPSSFIPGVAQVS
jgi:hypothetical protein